MPFFIWPQFPHICAGTTTRSEGNFSLSSLFDKEEQYFVQIRRKKLLNFLGFRTLHTFRQTHSTIILPPDGCSQVEADGLIGSTPGDLLVINTGDCIPLFFYAPDIETISIVHCGRVGLKNLIALKAIENLVQRGANASNIYVHIGPHISAEAYEVGKEILKEFGVFQDEEKGYLNMQQILIDQLTRGCISSINITSSNMCTLTSKNPEGTPVFYSHRGGDKERIFSFVGIREYNKK
ncbi:MAG: polyphenol oxidase family protein [Brevinema sp.]